MSALRVQCPNCKKSLFETTDRYNPDVTPNGSMVKSLVSYHIDWLTTSTTGVSEMTCPECLAQLAPGGKLTVILPESGGEPSTDPVKTETVDPKVEVGEDNRGQSGATPPKQHICPICGKEAKNAMGLNSHMRSHKE